MTEEIKHYCAAKGCHKEIKKGKLMCFPHWKSLPNAIQQRVNFAWAGLCKNRTTETLKAYNEARNAAINYIAEANASNKLAV